MENIRRVLLLPKDLQHFNVFLYYIKKVKLFKPEQTIRYKIEEVNMSYFECCSKYTVTYGEVNWLSRGY